MSLSVWRERMSKSHEVSVFAGALLAKVLKVNLVHGDAKNTALSDLGDWLCTELQMLGPVYVKCGQIMSTQSNVPTEITAALQQLQDKAAMLPFSAVSDYVVLPSNVVHVVDAPLAAASLGIVYRGVWREDGKDRDAVIKVLRPNIRRELSSNLWGLARFMRRFSELSPEVHHLLDVIRQYRRSIWAEIDYVKEAANMDTLAGSLYSISSWNVVPEVLDVSCNHIVMQYVGGTRVTDATAIAKAGLHLPTVADNLIEAFLHQCLVADIFHSDPHPGNVAIDLSSPEPRFVWYDCGSVMRCSDQWRADLVRLALAVLKSDVDGMAAALESMHIVKSDRPSRRAVSKFISMMLAEQRRNGNPGAYIASASSADVMESITYMMNRDPAWKEELRKAFVSNSKYVILGKSLLVMNANCVALDPTFNLIPRSLPFVNRCWQAGSGTGRNDVDMVHELLGLAKNISQMPANVATLENKLMEVAEDARDRHNQLAKNSNTAIMIQVMIMGLLAFVQL